MGTTITGKGAIPENHPLAIGVVGDNGYREYANELVAEADLIFYVGCKTGSVTTIRWTLPDPGDPPTIIHLDIDPQLIGNNYPTAVGLVGDAQLILADLVASTRERSPRAAPGGGRTHRRVRAAWWAGAADKMASDQMPMKPHRVMAALRRVLPEDAVVVADAGTPTPYVSRLLRGARPGRQVIIPRAYGGLGYAIPAAIGATIARPGISGRGLCGDGSFGMSAGELETLARLRLPVVIVNFNNALLRLDQGHPEHPLRRASTSGWTSPRSTTPPWRGPSGMRGSRVERAADLEDALEAAHRLGRPTLVDVPTESEEKDLPQVQSLADRKRSVAEAADDARYTREKGDGHGTSSGRGWGMGRHGCRALAARMAGAEVVLLERTDMLLGTGLVGGIIRNNGRFTAAEEHIAMGMGELWDTDRRQPPPQERDVPRPRTCRPVRRLHHRARHQELCCQQGHRRCVPRPA